VPTGRITKTSVDNLTPLGGDLFLWDSDLRGFGVKATVGGAKSYLIQYRMGGRGAKVRRLTIGRHGSPWTPDFARTEARRLLLQVGQGIDVAAAKREKGRQARELGFKDYVSRFTDDYLKERWSRSWRDAKSALDRYVVPVLRDKPLPDLTRSDIKAVMDKLRGNVGTRRKVYAILRRMFRWAISEGDLERSPLDGVEAPPAPASRDRVLADWEVRLIYEAAGCMGQPFGPLIRLLLLTGQRLKELAGLNWYELDRTSRMMTIPASRAKNRRAADVPLSDAVLAELDRIAGSENWPSNGLLFTTTGKTPLSGFSRAKRHVDVLLVKLLANAKEDRLVAPWRYHDLRRTFATGMQRLGVRFEVTEALLNHISGSRAGVAGIYQRHDWKQEKRVALDAWGAHIYGLFENGTIDNVVSLRRSA
jgi:integrase